ncbi:hypothetical protein Glove_120g44 [Diversispora epigaea]|uniref:Uncharacterized protein n=1 Tax=Diversispora epigaea TaxID=1348612 RepID=A0A397J3Z6_9GLOM|nr:hypothetical protein Glove_120g44 [Diversispora epigaea]
MIKNFIINENIKDKTAGIKLYKEIKPFLPNVTNSNLRKKIQRARKILKLFGEGGISIAKLNRLHMMQVSDLTKSLISNSSDSKVSPISKFKENLPKIKKTLSEKQNNPVHTYTNFRNKTLDQYLDLYYEYRSKKNIDYYGVNAKSPYPICKLNHEEENDLKSHDPWITHRAYSADLLSPDYVTRSLKISDKILTSAFLEWQVELIDVLTDKIHFKLYKRYKNEIGLDPWMDSKPSESFEEKTLFVPQGLYVLCINLSQQSDSQNCDNRQKKLY